MTSFADTPSERQGLHEDMSPVPEPGRQVGPRLLAAVLLGSVLLGIAVAAGIAKLRSGDDRLAADLTAGVPSAAPSPTATPGPAAAEVNGTYRFVRRTLTSTNPADKKGERTEDKVTVRVTCAAELCDGALVLPSGGEFTVTYDGSTMTIFASYSVTDRCTNRRTGRPAPPGDTTIKSIVQNGAAQAAASTTSGGRPSFSGRLELMVATKTTGNCTVNLDKVRVVDEITLTPA